MLSVHLPLNDFLSAGQKLAVDMISKAILLNNLQELQSIRQRTTGIYEGINLKKHERLGTVE